MCWCWAIFVRPWQTGFFARLSVPFEDHPQYFRQILTSIANIRHFRGGMTVEEIRSDRKTEAAIERELQIITEAAARLGTQGALLCPDVNWREIRDFGNILRHTYDQLDPNVLQAVLDYDLQMLEPRVRAALARLEQSI